MTTFKNIQNNLINQFQTRSIRYSFLSKIIYLAIAGLSVYSCKSFDDPSIEVLASYDFNYTNSYGIELGGEYLKDSIYVNVYNRLMPLEINGFKVEFQIISGGGSVDHQQVLTRKNGKAATRWKLGIESFNQTAIAKVYSPEGKFLSKIQLNAYGMLYNSWNEVNISPLNGISDIAADTVNHVSWMISNSQLYKRGSHFMDWIPVYNQQMNNPREIEIDKNSTFYVGCWNGELFKSTDHGDNWKKCTNPIPERPYYFQFWITNDGDLWASVFERGLWHSKDGGMTWANPNGSFINGAFRLKNGWLISLFGDQPSIMKSEDDGETWSSLTTPAHPYCYYVTENEDIIVCTQGNPAGIHKSTDLGESFNQVHSVPVTFGTGSLQTYFKKFESYYYMLVPGYGILKTKNFEQFTPVFGEPNINGIYIDHTGSILATGTLDKRGSTFIYGRD